jgi:hypothetical protein
MLKLKQELNKSKNKTFILKKNKMKPIAIPPLTEEQKQTVRNYFNGDTA